MSKKRAPSKTAKRKKGTTAPPAAVPTKLRYNRARLAKLDLEYARRAGWLVDTAESERRHVDLVREVKDRVASWVDGLPEQLKETTAARAKKIITEGWSKLRTDIDDLLIASLAKTVTSERVAAAKNVNKQRAAKAKHSRKNGGQR